jgi:hypothetical protein
MVWSLLEKPESGSSRDIGVVDPTPAPTKLKLRFRP